jgi:hypothetical protein
VKIQRPGPDAPGGPRIEQTCEVCREPFWPRVVDVDAGHGKRCQKRCELRERCSVCGEFKCWLSSKMARFLSGTEPECRDCRKARLASAKVVARAARSPEGRWQRIQSGELRSVTLAEFRRITGHSPTGLRPADARTRLGGAYDGTYINLDHPLAAAFLAKPKRPHKPRPLATCACPCRRSFHVKRDGHVFATGACSRRARALTIVIAGQPFSSSELVQVTGRSQSFVLERIRDRDLKRLFSPRPGATARRSPSSP